MAPPALVEFGLCLGTPKHMLDRLLSPSINKITAHHNNSPCLKITKSVQIIIRNHTTCNFYFASNI